MQSILGFWTPSCYLLWNKTFKINKYLSFFFWLIPYICFCILFKMDRIFFACYNMRLWFSVYKWIKVDWIQFQIGNDTKLRLRTEPRSIITTFGAQIWEYLCQHRWLLRVILIQAVRLINHEKLRYFF